MDTKSLDFKLFPHFFIRQQNQNERNEQALPFGQIAIRYTMYRIIRIYVWRKIDGSTAKRKRGESCGRREAGSLRTEDYLSNDLLYVLGMVLSGLFIAYLSLPCLNKARISSNVLFLVSGTCLYVKIQKMARNALNGRNV